MKNKFTRTVCALCILAMLFCNKSILLRNITYTYGPLCDMPEKNESQ